MGEGGSKLPVGAGDVEKTSVDADISSGEGEGIRRAVIEDLEVPAGAGEGDYALKPIGHPVDPVSGGAVSRERFFGSILSKGLFPLLLQGRGGGADGHVTGLGIVDGWGTATEDCDGEGEGEFFLPSHSLE